MMPKGISFKKDSLLMTLCSTHDTNNLNQYSNWKGLCFKTKDLPNSNS